MASVGNIFVRVGIKDNTKKQLKSIFGGMKSQMLKFGAAFGAFNFFKEGINQASDYAEAQDSLNRLIGQDGVKALEKFGKTSSATAGLSSADALTIANNFAGLFQQIPEGAIDTGKALTDLEQRVADLGSQFNKSNEEIFTGLQSALSGRVSLTLQQMGIDLSATAMQAQVAAGAFEQMGISHEQSFANLDKGTQVLLRYNSFLNQTNKSAGNFAATLGISLPNQIKKMNSSMKNAQQNIGKALIPTLMKVLPLLNKMANFIEKNTSLILGLAAAFIGFKLGSFIGKMIQAIALLMGVAAAKTAAQTGIGALVSVPTVIGAVGGIIGGILGGVGLSMGSSGEGGGGNSTTPEDHKIEISVTNNNVEALSTRNGKNTNVQTNFSGGL